MTPTPRVLRAGAASSGAIDAQAPDIAAAVAGAEVVFVAAPVGALAADRRAHALAQRRPDCVVSDVGSTKRWRSRPRVRTSASSAAIRSPAPRPPASSTPARTCSTARPGT